MGKIDRKVSIRCTEGERAIIDALPYGMRKGRYIVGRAMGYTLDQLDIDYDTIEKMNEEYADRGDVLNDIAYKLNGLAVLSSGGLMNIDTPRNIVRDAVSLCKEISRADADIRARMRPLTTLKLRAAEVVSARPVPLDWKPRNRQITIRVTEAEQMHIKEWAHKTGFTITELFLLSNVYENIERVLPGGNIVSRLMRESARQINNANQIGDAIVRVHVQTRELKQPDPVTSDVEEACSKAASATKELAEEITKGLPDVARACTLERWL